MGNSVQSNNNVYMSLQQSMPVVHSTTQTTTSTATAVNQERPQIPPKAHSSYIPSSTALVTTSNNNNYNNYNYTNNTNTNNQIIPYEETTTKNSSAQGPLSTCNTWAKLSQMTSIIAKHVPPNASPLPFLPIHAAGYILCRISFRTLLFKKWKQCYWVLYGTTKLLIFRSKEDADDWRFNPYHTKNERDFLVRLCIDFLNDCKIIQNCKGYKISPMGHKSYGRRKDHLLYHFKLERCMDYGPVIAACFASQDKDEIDTIRKVIIHCIKYSLKELKQINNNTNTTGNDNMNQSMPSSPAPPIAFTSSYDENQLHQQQQNQPFGYNDDYVFDYESGKPIPISEFQTRRHSAQPKKSHHNTDTTIARGRYSEN